MLESNSDILKSIDRLMDVYKNYEMKDRKQKFTPDFHQFEIFRRNPITPFHKEYFSPKYKTNHYTISYLLLILSILFSALYFVGFIFEAYFSDLPPPWCSFLKKIKLIKIDIFMSK